jgi:hypothetical protein
MVYAGDCNLLENIEILLVAGNELNKLRMCSGEKHKGQNRKKKKINSKPF